MAAAASSARHGLCHKENHSKRRRPNSLRDKTLDGKDPNSVPGWVSLPSETHQALGTWPLGAVTRAFLSTASRRRITFTGGYFRAAVRQLLQ